MSAKISRRLFLKGSLLGAGAAALPAVATARAKDSVSRQPLATLLDISKCVGCGACVEACRESNADKFPEPVKPFPKMLPERVKVEDWSDNRAVDDRLTPYNWLTIQSAAVTIGGEAREINIPRRCMHCVNPPCVKLCPWGAARQEANGLSRIDSDLCMGGAKCRQVCPWKIPQRQTGVGLYLDLMPSLAGNGVMYKCDRCHDRLAEGELPACVEACPEGVQTIGPRDEIIKKAHDLAKEMGGYIYGETENGGTNTIYVSPVPFKDLNKAIDKGPGRPHLKPVADAMADADNMATALVLAPVAGVAAAVGRFVHSMKNSNAATKEDENVS
ncbi:MAG: 4Fe-4S dicluster domain-containing protein [Pseudomonadota bacterium]